jgi:hypothetical protein
MRKLLMATALLALAAVTPASANVVLDTTGQGGTGTNVVFTGIDANDPRLILGHLNGQNNEIVRFFDRSNTTGFTGQASGQSIKIENTRDLDITIWDSTNTTQLGTTENAFSIKGTGNIFFLLQVAEPDGTINNLAFTNLPGGVAGLGGGGYDLGNGNQQKGFDFIASGGEVIVDLDLYLGVGGKINDFEHFRIDVSPIPQVAAVPELSTWALMCIGFAGLGFMAYRRRENNGGQAFRLA